MYVVACNQMNVLNDYTRLENEWGILPLMTKLFWERERERAFEILRIEELTKHIKQFFLVRFNKNNFFYYIVVMCSPYDQCSQQYYESIIQTW